MFKKVQKQLTILYTVLTGSILIILLAFISYRSISIREQQQETDFHNLWFSVSSRLQSYSFISDAYLAQMEVTNQAVIYIEENSSPLFFSGAWTPPTEREQLIKAAVTAAGQEGVDPTRPPVSSSASQTSLLRIQGRKGDWYYGRVMVLPTAKGAKSLLMLSYITPRSVLLRQGLSLFVLTGAAGILGILVISWFLTGRALQPARDGIRKQNEFVAAASHELRSPLAVIRSSLSALESELPGETGNQNQTVTLRQLIKNSDRECRRMARLVGDMLLLASSDAGNWELHYTQTEPDTLLIEAYEAFLLLCREKNINLILELPKEPFPPLLADRQRLEQVVTILLDNAISYTPAGKEVRLKMYKKEGSRRISAGYFRTVIEVADTGKGVPDEMKQRIFDRFYRGDASRKDKKHFGLGLSIAKELTEMHGGTLAVHDNPGGGSRFVVTLTLQQA